VIANRPATAAEIATSIATSIAILLASFAVARRVGVLRRPYDQWLVLKIAD
jgi:hypothetical protein